ncbi:MAG: BACON domain-containing carbohydrate-binding protein, partial [Bacteroidia bacterium]
GGTGTVNVTAGSTCNWTATTTSSWITITSGSSGTGNGTVTYTVASNTGTTQRTGTISIGGQTHTVAQSGNTSCTYTVSPLSQTFSSASATGTVTVTTTSGCNWVATSNDSWITITSGSSGSGNGSVTYTITSNTSTSQRVGTITIAGQVYTVTQSGTIPCSYTISPTNLSYAATGGNGTVTVTTTSGCNWTASTNDSWITITSGSSGSGNGSVTYTVASNSGTSQRTGSITIGGQTHTVAQSGNTSCTFTISPLNQTFTDQAATGSVTVTAASGCNWAATSNDSWITVTSGSTGSGNGTVSYSVTANTSTSQRVGTITIAGQVHSITQSGTAPCAYTIAPASLNYNSSGGSGVVNVTAGTGCTWTSTSNDAWITITSGSSGSGNGSVNYTVANNTTTTQRTGTITVAGQTHTVIQAGLQCTYTIAPTALSYTASAGTGTVNVTAAAGCAWTATTTDSWITITSGTGTGSGTAGYSVAANTNTAQRLGSITIAGQTHTVVQNGTSSCTFTLTPSSQTFTAVAGSGSISVAAASGCNWTAISNDSWIFISSGNTGSGNGTVNFTVSASTSTTQRTGTITVGGQIYTVTQSGITCPPTPVMQSVGCALAANGISNVNYQWYLSGTPIIGAVSQFYTANQPGFYSVYVTDITNGCVSSSQPAYVACSGVGIEEYSLADAIVIYPNPSAGDFNIKSSGVFAEEKVKVSIVNTLGQSIYSSFVTAQNGEINLTINGLNPPKGTYTVLFTTDKAQIAKRVTVN